MSTLYERLRNFDWYYGYSDDNRVWRKGRLRLQELSRDLEGMECPYSLTELRQVVHEQVEDLYEWFDTDEDLPRTRPGGFYKPELRLKYASIAPTSEDDMIARKRYSEIADWITAQG
jgi:hypothetical protein